MVVSIRRSFSLFPGHVGHMSRRYWQTDRQTEFAPPWLAFTLFVAQMDNFLPAFGFESRSQLVWKLDKQHGERMPRRLNK